MNDRYTISTASQTMTVDVTDLIKSTPHSERFFSLPKPRQIQIMERAGRFGDREIMALLTIKFGIAFLELAKLESEGKLPRRGSNVIEFPSLINRSGTGGGKTSWRENPYLI